MSKDLSDFDIIDRFPQAPVLVAGDIMLDRFVYGDVSRISPEAPVPVLKIASEKAMLGGAGNVLSNLRALGAPAMILAMTGPDSAGAEIRAKVNGLGIGQEGLIEAKRRATTVKTRYLASHQQLLRTDSEQAEGVTAAIEDQLIDAARMAMSKARALILSDYGKGLLTPRVIAALIALAHQAKIPVLVDPKGHDYSIYRGADIVTPNRKELSEATHAMPTATDDEVVAACATLIAQSGINAVVATRSQDGLSVVETNHPPLHLRTEAIEVFDVSGAGDTVIATIAAAIAAGAPLAQAARMANCAGGLVVAKAGTATVSATELQHALRRRGLDGEAHQAVVCEADEAARIVAHWKDEGLKVGFTNGCFDILHRGHVGYLARARARCDRLVLGLNVDASITRLKGPTRPVNDEDSRAAVMAALSAIDLVVFFGRDRIEDDKPVRLVQTLKPSILFKGGDYTEDQLPEAQAVRAYGGDVEIMRLYEGHSTTAMIARMKTGTD